MIITVSHIEFGLTISLSVETPSGDAPRNSEGLIYGFEEQQYHQFAGCVAAKLSALLGSVVVEVQESLIEVHKSRTPDV